MERIYLTISFGLIFYSFGYLLPLNSLEGYKLNNLEYITFYLSTLLFIYMQLIYIIKGSFSFSKLDREDPKYLKKKLFKIVFLFTLLITLIITLIIFGETLYLSFPKFLKALTFKFM